MSIGTNIRRLRVDAGLTQQELADTAEVSRSMIVKLEIGREDAQTGKLRKIADALKVKLTALLADIQP